MKFLFGVETFRNEVIDPGCNFECVSGSSCCTGRETEKVRTWEWDLIAFELCSELGCSCLVLYSQVSFALHH